MSQENKDLISPAATADREKGGFKEAAVSYLDHLYRVAFHLARQKDDAEDLVQETYLQAVVHYAQFTPGTNLKGWLTKILYNLFVNRYHRNKRTISLEEVGGDEGTRWLETLEGNQRGPEAEILKTELQDKIKDALDSLTEEFRAPIILVDIGDCSYAEVAEILSCPIGTVRSRLFRARSILAGRLRYYVQKE